MMDNHLKSNAFFVGKSISLADIAIGAMLHQAFTFVLDEKIRKEYK